MICRCTLGLDSGKERTDARLLHLVGQAFIFQNGIKLFQRHLMSVFSHIVLTNQTFRLEYRFKQFTLNHRPQQHQGTENNQPFHIHSFFPLAFQNVKTALPSLLFHQGNQLCHCM